MRLVYYIEVSNYLQQVARQIRQRRMVANTRMRRCHEYER